MSDAFQRLQFISPVVTISSFLLTAAIWIEEPDWQARLKILFIFLTLILMNSVLTTATAKAIRIRKLNRWSLARDEKIHLIGDHDGDDAATEEEA